VAVVAGGIELTAALRDRRARWNRAEEDA
jgi:hypothetical protein